MGRFTAFTIRAAVAGAVLTLGACATSAPMPASLPPPAPPPLDASFDWHVLLIAPIGSALKDVPATMHEVLLFRDEAPSAASADEFECFAVDSKPPRFAARVPAEYLLCFKHDRLLRIEAAVRLPADEAAKIYADACALWAKNGQPAAEGCEGTDHGIAFLGHLDSEPQGAETAMTVQLDAAPDRP
jgi:hypothetical protein